MIQTRGFNVDVIPQFVGADPSLVALNPNNAISGILQSLHIADTMNKIKAFKAQEQYLNAIRSSKAQAEIAQANKIAALAPLEQTAGMATIPAIAGAQVAQANQVSALTPIETAAKMQTIPALAGAAVATAGQQVDEAGIAKATLPFRKDTAIVSAEGEAQRAPTQQELLAAAQHVAKIKSDYAPLLATAEGQMAWREAEAGLNSAKTTTELKQAAIEAETKLKEAEASHYQKMDDMKLKIAEIAAQRHSQINDAYKIAQNDESRAQQTLVRLGSIKVPNPDPANNEAKPEIPLSELAGALYEEVDGQLVPKSKGALWWKGAVSTNPLYNQLLQQYQAQLQRVKESQAWQDELSVALKANFRGKEEAKKEQPKEQPKQAGTAKSILDKYGIK